MVANCHSLKQMQTTVKPSYHSYIFWYTHFIKSSEILHHGNQLCRLPYGKHVGFNKHLLIHKLILGY